MYQLILTVRGDKVRINYLTLFTVFTRKVRRGQAGGQCDQSVSLFELHLRVDTVDTDMRQGNPTPTITRSQ